MHMFLRVLGFTLFVVLMVSFSRTIWKSRQALKSVETKAVELDSLKKEVEELEATVQTATSSYMLEKRVREELQLQRSGEKVIEVE